MTHVLHGHFLALFLTFCLLAVRDTGRCAAHLRRAILLLLNSEGHSTGEAQNRLQSWNLHNQELSPWWLQSPAFCVMLLVGEWVFGAISTGHCSEFFRGELVLLHMGTEA